jgi:uncharacterized protein YmfQ (DUF2313 family)
LRFFETIKLLFPRARAFELFIDTIKRKIVSAFSVLPEDIRHSAELVFMDLFPDTTRFPEKWERTFAVYFKVQELSKRRDILDSLWKINNGGQSAVFFQNILQAIDSQIKVIENVPVTNPRNVLVNKINVCKSVYMKCGMRAAVCGGHFGSKSFIPSVLRNDISEFYSIPVDPHYWQMCFFVCNGVIRTINKIIIHIEPVKVNIVWKNYIEYLILKMKPVQSTAILFIRWEDEE